MYQEKYWKEFYQLKVHTNYVQLYLESSERWDRSVNMFLAIASSSSIAGWVVWDNFSFVWAFIIAASQVITAIKVFLPHKSRQKSLSGLLPRLESLLMKTESKWFLVSEGRLSDKQMHDLQFKVRENKVKLLNKYLSNSTLPVNKNLFHKAQETADTYIDHFYPTE